MTDELLQGPAMLRMQAEREAQANLKKTENNHRNELKEKADIHRLISTDDALKAFRYFAEWNYQQCLDRLLDPKKRVPEETTEGLRAEAHTHKMYLDVFEVWSRDGKDAMKELLRLKKEGEK